jgi:hypothetical protein
VSELTGERASGRRPTFSTTYIMDALQHRLTQYKGAPGQGSTVKSALNVHHAEILKLTALVATLHAQVARLETALQPEPEPEPEPLTVARAEAPEACPILAVAAVVAPVVAAVVLPAVAAALSSEPAAPGAADSAPPQVVGHYSVTAGAARPVPRGSTGGTPVVTASSGNAQPIPAAVQAVEEGSETDSVEAILLEAEQHSADRYMSLAKHQQATTAKVRAAAARKRDLGRHHLARPGRTRIQSAGHAVRFGCHRAARAPGHVRPP